MEQAFALLVQQEHNVHRIKPLKVSCLQIREAVDDPNHNLLDNILTTLEELHGELVRDQRLMREEVVDSDLDLFFRERVIVTAVFFCGEVESLLVEV